MIVEYLFKQGKNRWGFRKNLLENSGERTATFPELELPNMPCHGGVFSRYIGVCVCILDMDIDDCTRDRGWIDSMPSVQAGSIAQRSSFNIAANFPSENLMNKSGLTSLKYRTCLPRAWLHRDPHHSNKNKILSILYLVRWMVLHVQLQDTQDIYIPIPCITLFSYLGIQYYAPTGIQRYQWYTFQHLNISKRDVSKNEINIFTFEAHK